jgi:PIN domain nuclease of toxin-antitoxin system
MHTLLDTHALIWFLNGDRALSANAKHIIEADSTINMVSIASLWEIAIKVSLGKLELKVPFSDIARQIENNGFLILPITFEDVMMVASLPFHHRDPFDRIIVAQGIRNQARIITKDEQFNGYDVTTIW